MCIFFGFTTFIDLFISLVANNFPDIFALADDAIYINSVIVGRLTHSSLLLRWKYYITLISTLVFDEVYACLYCIFCRLCGGAIGQHWSFTQFTPVSTEIFWHFQSGARGQLTSLKSGALMQHWSFTQLTQFILRVSSTIIYAVIAIALVPHIGHSLLCLPPSVLSSLLPHSDVTCFQSCYLLDFVTHARCDGFGDVLPVPSGLALVAEARRRRQGNFNAPGYSAMDGRT